MHRRAPLTRNSANKLFSALKRLERNRTGLSEQDLDKSLMFIVNSAVITLNIKIHDRVTTVIAFV